MVQVVNGYKDLNRLPQELGYRYRNIPADNLGYRKSQGWEEDAKTDPDIGPVYYRIRKPEDKPAPVEEAPKPPSELEILQAKIEVLTQKVDEQAGIIESLASPPAKEAEPEPNGLDEALADEN